MDTGSFPKAYHSEHHGNFQPIEENTLQSTKDIHEDSTKDNMTGLNDSTDDSSSYEHQFETSFRPFETSSPDVLTSTRDSEQSHQQGRGYISHTISKNSGSTHTQRLAKVVDSRKYGESSDVIHSKISEQPKTRTKRGTGIEMTLNDIPMIEDNDETDDEDELDLQLRQMQQLIVSTRKQYMGRAMEFEINRGVFLDILGSLVSDIVHQPGINEDVTKRIKDVWDTCIEQNLTVAKHFGELAVTERDLTEIELRRSSLSKMTTKTATTTANYQDHGNLRSQQLPLPHTPQDDDSSNSSSSTDTLARQLYDKVGDANLACERLYNLESDFKFSKMARESEEEEGIKQEISDYEFHREYFSNKRSIIQEFADAKESAMHLYTLCLEQNIKFEDLDVPQLDPRLIRPAIVRNPHTVTSAVHTAPTKSVRPTSILLPQTQEPIDVNDWRIKVTQERLRYSQSGTNSESERMKLENLRSEDDEIFKRNIQAKSNFSAETISRRYSEPFLQQQLVDNGNEQHKIRPRSSSYSPEGHLTHA